MRVIHVIPSVAARTGGPAHGTLALVGALGRRGIDASVFTTDQAGPAQLGAESMSMDLLLPAAAADCDVRLFEITRLPRLAYAPDLGRALEDEARVTDVIHIHSLFLYTTMAASQAAQSSGTPYVVTPHGSLDPWIRRSGRLRKAITHATWQARMFAAASAVQATTPEEAAWWPSYVRRRPVHVIPNGIHVAEFRDMPGGEGTRAELGIDPEVPLIVNVGRIARKKGLDILIQAVAELHRSGIRAHVALVGPDDEGLEPRLRELAASEHVADHVHFMGYRDGLEKMSALAAADVWALPSHTENFGIAVLEALAAGCPVVVSDGVALAPQIEAANAGIVTTATVPSTADGLRRLLLDEDLRQRLAANGRVFAAQFDWDAVAEQMHALYEALAQSRSGRRFLHRGKTGADRALWGQETSTQTVA